MVRFKSIPIAGALAMLTCATGFGQEKTPPLETGTFHGKVHNTSGSATIYKQADGRLPLRLTNFKTSNGPDVHVVSIAAKDAGDDANFLNSGTERLEPF